MDEFAPVSTRFVRFMVLSTKDGSEPCIDELQIIDATETNIGLAANGSKATASSLLPGYAVHQIPHLNDGKFGNDHSWISATRGTGWAQIELPRESTVKSVVWSRDGGEIPRFDDRLPATYKIEVSLDGKLWITVATEAGRAGNGDYIHPDELKKQMTIGESEEFQKWTAERNRLIIERTKLTTANTAYIGNFTNPEPTFVLHLGDVMQRMDKVAPGGLSCTNEESYFKTTENAPEPERRLALAKWIGSAKNPLTARVIVNRVWQHHFGRGIVATPSDFGRNGEKPTHPELLDWLADDFVKHGWRMKRLHKMIALSYTYRQSNAANPKGIAVDAGNQFLWRMPLVFVECKRSAATSKDGKDRLGENMSSIGHTEPARKHLKTPFCDLTPSRGISSRPLR